MASSSTSNSHIDNATGDATKEQHVAWLASIGVSTSGTKDDVIKRVNTFKKYPRLVEKLKKKASRAYKFPTALQSTDIPPKTARWSSNSSQLPKVNDEGYMSYCSNKTEGNVGQQEKAVRLLKSRKIVSVKSIKDESGSVFVRGMIKKSYGHMTRPATIKFNGSVPICAHCPCPVGLSGLCCHVISLLLFLKHYGQTGEKILALTCTEQLQKWHKKSSKGSIPMVPLSQIKVVSARHLKTKAKPDANNQSIAADPGTGNFKRDVNKMAEKINQGISKIGKQNVEMHFYNVLKNSKQGQSSSLFGHLNYKYNLQLYRATADHDYLKTPLYDQKVLEIDEQRIVEASAFTSDQSLSSGSTKQPVEARCSLDKAAETDDISDSGIIVSAQTSSVDKLSDTQSVALMSHIDSQLESKQEVIIVNLQTLSASRPMGPNYFGVDQNTPEWHNLRRKMITGSRWPYLVGLHGHDKFDRYWQLIHFGLDEKCLFPSQFKNFERGHRFESEAISYFENASGCKTERCGFYKLTEDPHYGSSPDALCPGPILLEVKTRAENCSGPLDNLVGKGHYVLQPNLQMMCTGAKYCILESYHPESKSANFFLLKKDNLLYSVAKDLTDSILSNTPICDWPHHEDKTMSKLAEKVLGSVPTFEDIRGLRTYINRIAKTVPRVEFDPLQEIADQ